TSEETKQIKERPHQATVSGHSGLLVPRNFLEQKYATSPRLNLVEYPCPNPRTTATIAQPWEDFKKLSMKEYCLDDEIQKLESKFCNHKIGGSNIDGYMARFHELARLVPHMVTPESQRVNCYIRGLDPEIKAHVTSSEPGIIQGANKNQGGDDRNKRQRTGGNFALTVSEQGQGQRQASNERRRLTCFECGDLNHFRRDFPRMNRATTSRGNHPNLVLAIEGNTKQGNNRNRAQGRAFGLGVAEAPQDPNVVTSTFSLNNHFATILFDSSADYSFISTNFLPLINTKRSVIILGYDIEIASGVKVETNKIIQGCRLELEEVHEERPKGNLKQLKTIKVNEPKLEDILVVREFPGVFPEDLSGLFPSREVEFCILE
nr:hypothetical protein [Tanacetum cinerariifolium]